MSNKFIYNAKNISRKLRVHKVERWEKCIKLRKLNWKKKVYEVDKQISSGGNFATLRVDNVEGIYNWQRI